MFDSNAESKWTEFEASGSIADYLEYKGITLKAMPRKDCRTIAQSDFSSDCIENPKAY